MGQVLPRSIPLADERTDDRQNGAYATDAGFVLWPLEFSLGVLELNKSQKLSTTSGGLLVAMNRPPVARNRCLLYPQLLTF